jgi:hypothetical protein
LSSKTTVLRTSCHLSRFWIHAHRFAAGHSRFIRRV